MIIKTLLKSIALFCAIDLALAQFPVETKTVIVSVRDLSLGLTASQVLDEVERSTFLNRSERLNKVQERLEKWTTQSQNGLLEFLQFMKSNGHSQIQVEPLWITNKIIVRKADPVLITALQGRSDVSKVSDEKTFSLFPIQESNLTLTSRKEVEVGQNNLQWGVTTIKAADVWRTGSRGQGVVVGIIDTGVRGTHEAIKGNFRSSYGWYDPERKSATPNDGNGHGTHCTGTIVGTTNGIGVAPGAQWIACKGCGTSQCSESALLQCGQFMACPTDTQGRNKDCKRAPHVVSCSWGGGGGDNSYDDVIRAFHAIKIIPVFAVGNSGPQCNTVGSPGDSPRVIGVGSTDKGDTLSEFSSMGPNKRDRNAMKPDLSAPGGDVTSSWNSGDNRYNTISGTSMATPHVSGVVALMLSKNKELTFDQIRSTLIQSCEPVRVTKSRRNCGGVNDSRYPNNNSGYGRINAAKAVK